VSENEFEKAAAAGIRLVSRRMRTASEIKSALLKKGFSVDAADNAVGKMREYGYLDDKRYAELFVEYKSKSGGRRKLQFDMRMKGLSNTDIEESLSGLSTDDELTAAKAIAERYLRNKEKTIENKAKAARYLAGKGFGFEIAKRAAEYEEE